MRTRTAKRRNSVKVLTSARCHVARISSSKGGSKRATRQLLYHLSTACDVLSLLRVRRSQSCRLFFARTSFLLDAISRAVGAVGVDTAAGARVRLAGER